MTKPQRPNGEDVLSPPPLKPGESKDVYKLPQEKVVESSPRAGLTIVCAIVVFLVSLVACASYVYLSVSNRVPREKATTTVDADRVEATLGETLRDIARSDHFFRYEILEVDESIHDWGPQVRIDLETTNDVAKQTSEEDLRQFWTQISPSIGDRRVFIRIKTSVPGVSPWAIISRTNDNAAVNFSIYEHGIDALPYHFVNEIDRSLPNQGSMVITLPEVNQIQERLARLGWQITNRQEDYFGAKKQFGIVANIDLTLTPESIRILAYSMDGNEFFDTAQIVFGELGIGDQLKEKLYEVIGSPKHLRASSGSPAIWKWRIENIEIQYSHAPQFDDLDAGYAR